MNNLNELDIFKDCNLGELQADEYVKEGIIYCQKCNTPRVFYIDGSLKRCSCECKAQAILDEAEQNNIRKRQERIKGLRASSLIGDRYKDVTFDKTEKGYNETFDKAYSRCKRYCEVYDKVLERGMGIYIYGDKGTGKTHLTACMANELMSKGKQVLFTNFFEISKAIRATFNNIYYDNEIDYINKLANIDFLFIDDLGTERVQSKDGDLWLQEKIFDVLNKRYNMRRPTIFTSNQDLEQLVVEKGFMDKTVDRIAEMSHAILKIVGVSYRMKARENEDIPF